MSVTHVRSPEWRIFISQIKETAATPLHTSSFVPSLYSSPHHLFPVLCREAVVCTVVTMGYSNRLWHMGTATHSLLHIGRKGESIEIVNTVYCKYVHFCRKYIIRIYVLCIGYILVECKIIKKKTVWPCSHYKFHCSMTILFFFCSDCICLSWWYTFA